MSVKNTVRDFITRDLLMDPALALGDADELLLSGLVDSLGAMRLVAHLETAYGIKVPAEDVLLEHFESIDAIAAYLGRRGID